MMYYFAMKLIFSACGASGETCFVSGGSVMRYRPGPTSTLGRRLPSKFVRYVSCWGAEWAKNGLDIAKTGWNFAVLLSAVVLSGCVNANDIANRVGQPPAEMGKLRAIETRRFDTKDDLRLISIGTQTMQDLGFIISESSLEGGLVTGAKQRDATETGEVVGQIALTVLLAALGSYHVPVWDDNQTIQATIVTYSVNGVDASDVRVSFDRVVVNTQGQRRAEFIKDEPIYREFFQRYSTALALEGHPL